MRRWFPLIALCVLACPSRPDKTAPKPEPVVARVTADAAIDTPLQRGVKLAAVGKVDSGDGVRGMSIVGDYVYWSTIEDETQMTTFRRVARTGGTVEELGSTRSVVGHETQLDHAVIGAEIYVVGFPVGAGPPTTLRAPIFRLEGGKAKLVTHGPRGTFSSENLVAHDGKLYWVASTEAGPGPVLVTEPSGATKIAAACPKPTPDGCPALLPGAPAILATKHMTLLGAKPRKLDAKCPVCTIPSRALGTHVLCVPGPTSGSCSPVTTLVSLDGKQTIVAKDIDDTQRGGGFFYHHGDALSLHRRETFDGADEWFAPRADKFAVDDKGVAWIDADTLWAAPHVVQ